MFICYLTIYHGDLLPPFYIGSTSLINIKNGYKGSVVSKKYSKIFKQEIKNNKDLFEVLIISKHKTRKEAMIAELEIQKKLNAVKSEPFFNESYASIASLRVLCFEIISTSNKSLLFLISCLKILLYFLDTTEPLYPFFMLIKDVDPI